MKPFAFLVLSCLAGAAVGQDLRLGVAETDITPPVGSPMAGYYNNREATGVQRELKLAQIESRTIQKQSMMPEGLVNNLTPKGIADLIAYLQSLTSGDAPPKK